MKVSGRAFWEWWQEVRGETVAAAVPVVELEWFLQGLVGIDRLALRLGSCQDQIAMELPLSLDDLHQRWRRRLEERVPVQYLVGRVPWREFSLRVSPAVLIPRPETELLLDGLAKKLQGASEEILGGPWADLGTGSGAIALGLATLLPQAPIHAVDLSGEAVAIAQINAQEQGLLDHVRFYQGSWFEPLGALRGQLVGMVANPPYIPRPLLASLAPEVVDHEPTLALDGGGDGLDSLRHLVAIAPNYLRPGGWWLVETMADQPEAVVDLLLRQGCYDPPEVFADLAGIDRFVITRYQP